jgi:hypothetical protein
MKKESKTVVLRFRVTRDELKGCVIMARREGIFVSEMMRVALREAAQKRNLPPLGLIGENMYEGIRNEPEL